VWCAHDDVQAVAMQALRVFSMNADQADAIGKQFADHYYNTFKTDRNQLGRLYQDQSILTWEGRRFIGQQAVAQHLAGLPFGKIDFRLITVDCQPAPSNCIMVFTTGQLLTEGESNPLKFSQLFQLVNANNTWVLANDMFRLNLA
jgi:hypothetical protein